MQFDLFDRTTVKNGQTASLYQPYLRIRYDTIYRIVSGTAEATVVKFCIHVGYVKSQYTDDKPPLTEA